MLRPPEGKSAPLCACGCGQPTNWLVSQARFGVFLRGHCNRGRTSKLQGRPIADNHREAIRQGAIARYAGQRLRDLHPKGSTSHYQTREYLEAKARLVDGRICMECGDCHKIHAHHVIPGDDNSLVPLCASCHASVHTRARPHPLKPVQCACGCGQYIPWERQTLPGHTASGIADWAHKGPNPPPGEKAPLCRCGCGQPVKWKRHRGWGACLHGHANTKIAAAGAKNGPAPLCKCGCGYPCLWKDGKGWSEYRRAHRQRVEGVFNKNVRQNLIQFQKHAGDPVKSEMS